MVGDNEWQEVEEGNREPEATAIFILEVMSPNLRKEMWYL